jgi:hypothetical protein
MQTMAARPQLIGHAVAAVTPAASARELLSQ